MNFFYLSEDPEECAKFHCDKHVIKMVTEYKQCLSTAHRVLDGTMSYELTANNRKIKRWKHPNQTLDQKLFLASHVNHPTNIWLRECQENYDLMYKVYVACLKEYTYRYGKVHGSQRDFELIMNPPKNCPSFGHTTPIPQAMKQFPECMVPNNSLQAYRNFYNVAKKRFATWKNRPTPTWFGVKNANIQISK